MAFYSKHMPAEAFEIMQDIQEFSPVDLLWEQIQIQFTAIVRAQKIMFVESKDEMIKELKKKKNQSFRIQLTSKKKNTNFSLLGIVMLHS
ncbi:hypothetical protein BsIDN1_10780 [Bacillus safensis]|uniref:Uncharacterized protein n=1 Tax=Bacillus safensis TaxID=561879 RepID=A0A5S9M1J6_BACIA|nr:hypothetical protein BsIDN1_10780 [Bacillus safensis]